MPWPKGRPKPESVRRRISEAWDDSMRAEARARVMERSVLFPGRWDGDARERNAALKRKPCAVGDGEYESVNAAAAALGRNPRTIRRWLSEGTNDARFL